MLVASGGREQDQQYMATIKKMEKGWDIPGVNSSQWLKNES